jgi:hypothetical protein
MNSIFKLVGCQYRSLELNRKGHKLTPFTGLRIRNSSWAQYPARDTEEQTFCLHKACTDFGMRQPRDPRNREGDSNNCESVQDTRNILLKQTGAQKSGVPPNG